MRSAQHTHVFLAILVGHEIGKASRALYYFADRRFFFDHFGEFPFRARGNRGQGSQVGFSSASTMAALSPACSPAGAVPSGHRVEPRSGTARCRSASLRRARTPRRGPIELRNTDFKPIGEIVAHTFTVLGVVKG
jgi:hypothetical protein